MRTVFTIMMLGMISTSLQAAECYPKQTAKDKTTETSASVDTWRAHQDFLNKIDKIR